MFPKEVDGCVDLPGNETYSYSNAVSTALGVINCLDTRDDALITLNHLMKNTLTPLLNSHLPSPSDLNPSHNVNPLLLPITHPHPLRLKP